MVLINYKYMRRKEVDQEKGNYLMD
jgi:hypothetical protein